MTTASNTIHGKPVPEGHHLAAVLDAVNQPFTITHRPTPTPGPHDLLIATKAIAVNPVDSFQQSTGFNIKNFPIVLGADVAGVVIATGSDVSPNGPKVGDRVAVRATQFHTSNPDNGAYQARVLVPEFNAVVLPNNVSFNEGALLPVAANTAWAALYTLGGLQGKAWKAEDKKALLVWGASSSVGTIGVQVAKLLGYTVYATASPKHHAYIKALGARRVFDYNDPEVVDKIAQAAKEDGLTISLGYRGNGDLKTNLDALTRTRGSEKAILASAAAMFDGVPEVEGIEIKFVQPPQDPEESIQFSKSLFQGWLKEKLDSGELVPAPNVQVVPGGIEALQDAVNEWRKGVSAAKIVVEVSE